MFWYALIDGMIIPMKTKRELTGLHFIVEKTKIVNNYKIWKLSRDGQIWSLKSSVIYIICNQ